MQKYEPHVYKFSLLLRNYNEIFQDATHFFYISHMEDFP